MLFPWDRYIYHKDLLSIFWKTEYINWKTSSYKNIFEYLSYQITYSNNNNNNDDDDDDDRWSC